jgi:hypothetical protein
VIECCGNCVHFFVKKWLFPKVDGECIAPKVRYDKKSKKLVEVPHGPGLRNLTRTSFDHGREVHVVFDWLSINPKRTPCDRFKPGLERIVSEVIDKTNDQDEIWKRYG